MEGYSSEGSWSVNGTHSLGPDDSEYWMKLFDGEFGSFTDTNDISGSVIYGGGAMESINDPLNQAKTSQRKENKRQFDVKCRLKLKEKMAFLQGLVPGCSKVTSQVSMLEEIIDYVQSLQRQVEEKTYEQVAEILHLKKEKERLNAENTRLKDQVGLLLGKQIEHELISLQLCSLEPNELLNQLEDMAPVNAASLISGRDIILPYVNWCHFDVESQLNSTEAPRDACLQVQKIPHKNGMESVSVLQSNEEAKQGTCLSGNESDEAEFRSGAAEDEPSALDGPSGEPTAKLLSSKKRKRSVEEAEVDQARGGQLRNKALKDSTENLEKGDRNLTTTDKSIGKQGRGGSQTSDPLKEVYLNIRSRRRKSIMSCSLVIPETEKGKIMRFLRGVVPGFREVPAKAAILDETNNYVQSVQLKIEVFKLNSAFETVHTDILMKLEADDESTVKFSDFTGLDGERIKVGKYSVPLSLLPIVKNIIHVYGDVSATGKMNPYVAEAIYIMFCASVKEMSELRIEQVTEDRILKWRDAIKDALRSNFKVDFAMEHLKKIACAYIDLTEHLKLENEALRMFNFEAELSAGTEEFSDMPVSSGEKPILYYESVNGGGDDFDAVSCPPAGKKRQLTGSRVEFLDRSFEVENKLDPERKLVLTMEAELENMKESIREDEVAVQEKGEEYEMLMRKKQSMLAMEADAEKVVDDFTVFTKAIENDMNAQIIYERAMMNTIRSTLEALIQEA